MNVLNFKTIFTVLKKKELRCHPALNFVSSIANAGAGLTAAFHLSEEKAEKRSVCTGTLRMRRNWPIFLQAERR
jgi:hypothetical protein